MGGAQTLDAMAYLCEARASRRWRDALAREESDGGRDRETRVQTCFFLPPCIDEDRAEKGVCFGPHSIQMASWIKKGSSATGFSPPADQAGIPVGMPLSKRALNVCHCYMIFCMANRMCPSHSS